MPDTRGDFTLDFKLDPVRLVEQGEEANSTPIRIFHLDLSPEAPYATLVHELAHL